MDSLNSLENCVIDHPSSAEQNASIQQSYCQRSKRMSFSNQPLVSVLLAYYNDLLYIEDSIKSVFAQTYKNIELVVVDDCSPNKKAQELIASLQQRYGFKLIRNVTNLGPSKTFQKAFEISLGDYISIISHDDLYMPDKIEHSMSVLMENNLDVIYCNGAAFYNDNLNSAVPFCTKEVVEALEKGQEYVAELICGSDNFGCLLTQGAIYKRKVFSELSWMREKFLLDDYPFTIKVWQDYKTGFDKAVLYFYRHHDNNIHKNYWRWFPARIQVVSELVPPDKKVETISHLLISMGELSAQKNFFDDAIRFVSAGLVMADTEKNIKYAKAVLFNIKSNNKKIKLEGELKKIKEVLAKTTLAFKTYRTIARLIIFLIPNKRIRGNARRKLNI